MESEEQRQDEEGATNIRLPTTTVATMNHHNASSSSSTNIMRPQAGTSNNNNNNSNSPQEGEEETILKLSCSASKHSHNDDDDDKNNNAVVCCGVLSGVSWLDVYYICAWGIFGAVARMYVARLFGLDCETATDAAEQDDVDFWRASAICWTANGQTDRKGGALFIDLPANMLGCFLMGLLSASTQHPIPWFASGHHLQRHSSWHKGLTTGFCGCFTTFASWNTQMVIMLDGTQAENGSQIASALAGYTIGIMTAIAAFLWGRVVAKMWRNRHNNANKQQKQPNEQEVLPETKTPTFDEDDDDEDEKEEQQRTTTNSQHKAEEAKRTVLLDTQALSAAEPVAYTPKKKKTETDKKEESSQPEPTLSVVAKNETRSESDHGGEQEDDDDEETTREAPLTMMHMGGSILAFTTLSLVLALILGFVYGDVAGDYVFCRRMWIMCFCTPAGALLRHQLKQWLPSNKSIQWGTLTANVVGAVISILLEAITVRYLADDQVDSYLGCFSWALKVGFAGSLSTVSTLVKELVGLERLLDRHLYGILTLLISMSFGLAIYSPIVRS